MLGFSVILAASQRDFSSYYAGGFPLEVPLGIRGVGRMRNHRILWCMVAQKVT